MKFLKSLILSLVLISAPAVAAVESLVFEMDDIEIRLFKTPCVSKKVTPHLKTLEPVLKEMKVKPKDFLKSVVTWQGKKFDACYTVKDGQVLLIDENGDGPPPLDMKMFKKSVPQKGTKV